MTVHYDYVVIAGGLAGATAAETLRTEGAEGSIVILSAESIYPYQRPPLSKGVLNGEIAPEPRFILDPKKYQELNIEVLLNSPVTGVDTSKHLVKIGSGEEVHYKKLLIASGSTPKKLDIPGATLEGIHYLHVFTDASAIHQEAQTAKELVVIGGSFIGLEVAASLAQKGLKVALLEREHLLGQLQMPEVSEYFFNIFEKHGVRVLVGEYPVAFKGNGRVSSVETSKGEVLPCDLVVIGAGVVPEVDFLHGSGIKLDDGILVDEYLRTNRANIFAAGDVANYYDLVFGRHQRVEHWDGAVKEARVAAQNMLGNKVPYLEVPYFYSDVFDVSCNLLGLIERPYECIYRGSLESGSFAAFFLRDNIPIALFSLGRPSEETKVVESLIKHKVNLETVKSKLSDPDFSLSHIPNQNILILQGGGAFGAFECGAMKALVEGHISPNIVAGVSIGAFNGAIIAGNPDNPVEALEAFWNELKVDTPPGPTEEFRQMQACNQIAALGVPNFFKPRWLNPFTCFTQLPNQWTSLYDTSPVRGLLEKYVDFSKLKSSPVRLMISAVDVETSELVMFDSYIDTLTPDHILASGSLPPGFPWTTINGRHYWDGGIVSNSPLDQVLDRCGTSGKQVFVIDLFPGSINHLPGNLLDVLGRRDEILYSERIRSELKTQTLVLNFQKLVEEVMSEVPPEKLNKLRHRPGYIQLMASESPMKVTRITRENSEDEPSSKDYDFSRKTIENLMQSGYRVTKKALTANS